MALDIRRGPRALVYGGSLRIGLLVAKQEAHRRIAVPSAVAPSAALRANLHRRGPVVRLADVRRTSGVAKIPLECDRLQAQNPVQ